LSALVFPRNSILSSDHMASRNMRKKFDLSGPGPRLLPLHHPSRLLVSILCQFHSTNTEETETGDSELVSEFLVDS